MSSKYVPTEECQALVQSIRVEQQRVERERQQEKLYETNTKLQKIASTIPNARLSYDLLLSISRMLCESDSLLDIISNLLEVQHLAEENYYSQRKQLEKQFHEELKTLKCGHEDLKFENSSKPHTHSLIEAQISKELTEFESRKERELLKRDNQIIRDLDGMVSQQQEWLQRAGLPEFCVTTESEKLQRQTNIILLLTKYLETLPEHSG